MKKFILTTITFVLCLFSITSCNNNEKYNDYKVSFILKDGIEKQSKELVLNDNIKMELTVSIEQKNEDFLHIYELVVFEKENQFVGDRMLKVGFAGTGDGVVEMDKDFKKYYVNFKLEYDTDVEHKEKIDNWSDINAISTPYYHYQIPNNARKIKSYLKVKFHYDRPLYNEEYRGYFKMGNVLSDLTNDINETNYIKYSK